jgi:hypothetical protein
MERNGFRSDDVAAARHYIGAYVPFVHYVEGVYEAAISAAHGHYPEPPTTKPLHDTIR